MAPERHALTLFLFTSAVDGPRGRVCCCSPSRGKSCNVPQAGPNHTAHRERRGKGVPSSECANISFFALARHACERAHVRGQTRRAEAKLHVGHSCSSGSCFQTQIFIHRTCERSVQDGRIQAALRAGFPRFPPRVPGEREPTKHRGVKFSPGFPAH